MKIKPWLCISALFPKMPSAGPPCAGGALLIQTIIAMALLLCSSRACQTASKDKKVIDPTEEKKEPEARDRHTNWKNATFILLPKSILTMRKLLYLQALRLWLSLRPGEGFGNSHVRESTWKLHKTGSEVKKSKAARNWLRLHIGTGVVGNLPAPGPCHFGDVKM